MLSFDSSLKAILDTATTKLDWISKLNAALGNSRRLRCFRDADAAAADPYATGVEFLNIGNTGAIVGNGGNISSFGTVSGATIRLAADLATGASVLRIEGNGHWVQGTLGLRAVNNDADTSNDRDFLFNTNPTAKTGFGMKAQMRSPALLPSGTGPTAPDPDTDRPVYVELVDYRNNGAPVTVKTAVFSVRDENITFEDADLAAEMGDVRITFLTDSIVYDGFEFGAMLMSCNPVVNGDNSQVLHQVLVSCKPYGTWPTYPYMDTYNQHDVYSIVKPASAGAAIDVSVNNQYSVPEDITLTAIDATHFSVSSSVRGALPNLTILPTDDPGYYASADGTATTYAWWCKITHTGNYVAGEKFTFTVRCSYDTTKPRDVTTPSPFKIILRKLDNTILHTYEMHDGLPINSPLLSQKRTADEPLRPKFNCGMMLPWSSARPKMNSKRFDYGTKADPLVFRPMVARVGTSSNGAIPMITGRTQINSASQHHGAPRWSLGYGDTPQNDAKDPNYGDRYILDIKTYFSGGGAAAFMMRAVGWDYEPGSISLHDWYTGPGGPRFDRAAMPSPIITYLTNPNGTRARDNSAHKDNVDAWNLAYFNHANHYMLDVKNFTTISSQDINAGKRSYSRAYYGGTDNYVAGGLANHIAQWAIPNGSAATLKLDKNGQPIWNGWALDNLHNYCQPAWVVLLFNSPMHLIAAKHRYHAGIMAQLGGVGPNVTAGFLERNGAWRWLHWALMWKIGTAHRLGIAREDIAARWQKDMEVIYDNFVLPATDPTHAQYNSLNSSTLRNLGQLPRISSDAGYQGYVINSNCLSFYMAQVFLLMKTSGSWAAMYNRSTKCQKTMEFMMRCYDIFSVDFILDANGRAEGGYPYIATSVPTNQVPPTDIVTSWADWSNRFPANGQEDWMRNPDGSIRGYDRENAQHLRANWVFMRKDFFPEFPFPRLDEAYAKYQGYYNDRKAVVDALLASNATDAAVRGAEWTGLIPAFYRAVPVAS